VLTNTRSLTLGALIGAPTVREGLPPIAQYYAVEELVYLTVASEGPTLEMVGRTPPSAAGPLAGQPPALKS
jgi:hypothetical protein